MNRVEFGHGNPVRPEDPELEIDPARLGDRRLEIQGVPVLRDQQPTGSTRVMSGMTTAVPGVFGSVTWVAPGGVGGTAIRVPPVVLGIVARVATVVLGSVTRVMPGVLGSAVCALSGVTTVIPVCGMVIGVVRLVRRGVCSGGVVGVGVGGHRFASLGAFALTRTIPLGGMPRRG
ncbi:hypothetical protein ACFVVM_24965 [Nocardia sp. NPDC058176]|uniref:hypothetical protein n=1 Tax=Nocardia sp. NPDC058176 TaxID=3346368 RepID=UPI0036DE1831